MPSERIQKRIDRFLDQADEAAEARDWASVREVSISVLGVDPDNDDAKAFLEMAEPHLGDTNAIVATELESSNRPATPESDTPTSFADGRYEVTGFPGEGGKKKVYLAHDTTLDRDVAFGLIKAEGLDDASRQRITREAQAMARLGDNPNIMPIFDLGEENGQPYMVGPLMGGGDVEALLEPRHDSHSNRHSCAARVIIAGRRVMGFILTFSRILVPLDGSDVAFSNLPSIIELAKK